MSASDSEAARRGAGPFAPVRSDLDFPRDESAILAFWKRERIFDKTLSAETRRTGPSKGTFVFYEGPPTANGMPHNGHVLTRAVKDVFPRYKTMRGYDVPRKAGWGTHGLPVGHHDRVVHGETEFTQCLGQRGPAAVGVDAGGGPGGDGDRHRPAGAH